MDMQPVKSSSLDRIRDGQRDTWDRFSSGWRKWDELVLAWLHPYGRMMIRHANLGAASYVLDVASGTGEPGLTAAAQVPQGRVVVTDLAEGMLAVATENAARRGLVNVETRICEAGALPFPDAGFDAVLCRFGFMFFPDIVAAAREFTRVTKAGGRVSVAVWGESAKNPWATTVMNTIARHVPLPAPPPDAPGLFRCATPGFIRDVFSGAGLHHITEEEVSGDLIADTAAQYWEFMNDIAAPVVAGLARADGSTRDRVRTEVLGLAQQFLHEGSICIPSTAIVVAGTR